MHWVCSHLSAPPDFNPKLRCRDGAAPSRASSTGRNMQDSEAAAPPWQDLPQDVISAILTVCLRDLKEQPNELRQARAAFAAVCTSWRGVALAQLLRHHGHASDAGGSGSGRASRRPALNLPPPPSLHQLFWHPMHMLLTQVTGSEGTLPSCLHPRHPLANAMRHPLQQCLVVRNRTARAGLATFTMYGNSDSGTGPRCFMLHAVQKSRVRPRYVISVSKTDPASSAIAVLRGDNLNRSLYSLTALDTPDKPWLSAWVQHAGLKAAVPAALLCSDPSASVDVCQLGGGSNRKLTRIASCPARPTSSSSSSSSTGGTILAHISPTQFNYGSGLPRRVDMYCAQPGKVLDSNAAIEEAMAAIANCGSAKAGTAVAVAGPGAEASTQFDATCDAPSGQLHRSRTWCHRTQSLADAAALGSPAILPSSPAQIIRTSMSSPGAVTASGGSGTQPAAFPQAPPTPPYLTPGSGSVAVMSQQRFNRLTHASRASKEVGLKTKRCKGSASSLANRVAASLSGLRSGNAANTDKQEDTAGSGGYQLPVVSRQGTGLSSSSPADQQPTASTSSTTTPDKPSTPETVSNGQATVMPSVELLAISGDSAEDVRELDSDGFIHVRHVDLGAGASDRESSASRASSGCGSSQACDAQSSSAASSTYETLDPLDEGLLVDDQNQDEEDGHDDDDDAAACTGAAGQAFSADDDVYLPVVPLTTASHSTATSTVHALATTLPCSSGDDTRAPGGRDLQQRSASAVACSSSSSPSLPASSQTSTRQRATPMPPARMVRFCSKQPHWNARLRCWCLNFGGRVRLPSARNFQLCAPEGPGTQHDAQRVVLQFGKVSQNLYCLDWDLSLLNPVQALGCALTAFHRTLTF